MHRRDFYDPGGNTFWRIDLSGHREFGIGIFCPELITVAEFQGESTAAVEDLTTHSEFSTKIFIAKFNDTVPQSLFEIPQPRPGEIQMTDDGGYTQIAPGADDYAESLVDWINRVVGNRFKPVAIPAWELALHFTLYIVLIGFVVGSFLRKGATD